MKGTGMYNSLNSRLSNMNREERAQYMLFIHAHFPQDFYISVKCALIHQPP